MPRQVLPAALVVLAGIAVVVHERTTARELAQLTAAVERLQRPAAPMIACAPPLVAPTIVAQHERAAAPQVAAAPVAPSPSAREERPPPTAEQAAAGDSARQIVDAAIARGRLSQADMAELRQRLVQTDADARGEIARQIVVAINTNRLVPEGRLILP